MLESVYKYSLEGEDGLEKEEETEEVGLAEEADPEEKPKGEEEEGMTF